MNGRLPVLALGEPESAADREVVEDDDPFALLVALLGLDPRDEVQGEGLDLEVRLAALELNLPAQRPAGAYGTGVQHGVHGGAADAE